MIVLEFRAICTYHGLDKTTILKGHDTPRQLDKGYASLDRQMRERGCDDYNATHSVRIVPRGRNMPAKYNV